MRYAYACCIKFGPENALTKDFSEVPPCRAPPRLHVVPSPRLTFFAIPHPRCARVPLSLPFQPLSHPHAVLALAHSCPPPSRASRTAVAHLVRLSRLSPFAHPWPRPSVLMFPPILTGHLDAMMLVTAKTSNSPRSRNSAIRNLSI
ncbi:hypothetical protein DENSPDRAFT_263905 [Dentipellis sp. KUC8613]|nr:hypothetical protein DENSPDRAFT_263905 [Dentipellis sp. KUC8613]